MIDNKSMFDEIAQARKAMADVSNQNQRVYDELNQELANKYLESRKLERMLTVKQCDIVTLENELNSLRTLDEGLVDAINRSKKGQGVGDVKDLDGERIFLAKQDRLKIKEKTNVWHRRIGWCKLDLCDIEKRIEINANEIQTLQVEIDRSNQIKREFEDIVLKKSFEVDVKKLKGLEDKEEEGKRAQQIEIKESDPIETVADNDAKKEENGKESDESKQLNIETPE